MREPRNDKARGQAGQGAQQVQRESKHTTGRQSWRCAVCLDPAPHGWDYCLKCHAWSDLYRGMQEDGDPFRLGRALAYFRGRRPAEPLESVVAKLLRRLALVENDIDIMVNDRISRAYVVDERIGVAEAKLVQAIRPSVAIEDSPVFASDAEAAQ